MAAGTEAPISTLSGGNQQKVVVARCLAREPEFLVLSEPTAGVDIGTRVAIYELIAGLARDGLTVIVSSSDLGDLLAMCTRIVVLRQGRVGAELGGEGLTEHALVNAIEGDTPCTSVRDNRTECRRWSQAPPERGAKPIGRPAPSRPSAALARLARGLAFNKIGAVYVWLAIVVVFSIWVPDTFPTIVHGQAGPERQRDHGAGRAFDHDSRWPLGSSICRLPTR